MKEGKGEGVGMRGWGKGVRSLANNFAKRL